MERVFPDGANINPDLTPGQKQIVIDILREYKDAFISDSPILHCTTHVHHVIDIGSAAPIHIPPYRCSKAEEEVIQHEVDDMLKM